MTWDIIKELQIIVNNSGKEEIGHEIAKVILINIHNDFESITITDLAQKAYTSVSTVSRFIKTLGFDTFNEMKKQIINSKKMSLEMMQDSLAGMDFSLKNQNEVIQNVVKEINLDLKEYASNIDFEQIDRLIKLIHDSETINFYGVQLPGYFMQQLQYLFMNIGKYINFRVKQIENENLIKETTTETLSLIFSVDGNFVHGNTNIFYRLKERASKIILVTQIHTLKVVPYCDEVIYLNNYNNPKSGKYKLQLFIDILINKYYLTYKNEINLI